jgi:hypothetical protein
MMHWSAISACEAGYKLKTSPYYVHVIEGFVGTTSCGISRDKFERSYGVERSFGATGLPEFSTTTKK